MNKEGNRTLNVLVQYLMIKNDSESQDFTVALVVTGSG